MKSNKYFALLSTLPLMLGACSTSKVTTSESPSGYRSGPFNNPLITENCADPCIIRAEDGYYYIYSTTKYRDGKEVIAPCFRSKDMIEVEFMGSCLETKPNWTRAEGGIWAPDVIYRNNIYYYYYTLGCGSASGDIKASGIGVATSSSPAGPFVDHGKLFDGYDVDYGSTIDQSVFEYEGKLYLAFGTFAAQGAYPNQAGIYYFELEDDGLSVKNIEQGKKLLLNDWTIEGPYIIKMKDSWYLFGSGGTCCRSTDSSYYVKVYKADTPFGPWKDASETYTDGLSRKLYDYNGELVIASYDNRYQGNKIGDVAGPGHNAVFEDDRGNYYIFYHGWDRKETFEGRGAFYDRLVFDSNGFPHVENYVSSYGETILSPALKY